MIEFCPAPASCPPGKRIYAVGDVHGCLDRLRVLHAAIAADLAERPAAGAALLVHLGDYVDRGPDSAGVIELLASGHTPAGITRVVNLMGNHEELMLSALDQSSDEAAPLWLMNGGADSLHSWRVPRQAEPKSWASLVPPAHVAFLRSLALTHRCGGYLFVHAGLRPRVPVAQQDRHDLLWIRQPFLTSKEDFGAVVVHGHTPRREPEVRPNRIGIDTGAVMGGDLTCVVLEEDRLGFLTA